MGAYHIRFKLCLHAIKDNGISIPRKLQENIVKIVSTVKRKGTVGDHSSGLDLSICRRIVEAHKGNIWFESEEGNGTTFFIMLPL